MSTQRCPCGKRRPPQSTHCDECRHQHQRLTRHVTVASVVRKRTPAELREWKIAYMRRTREIKRNGELCSACQHAYRTAASTLCLSCRVVAKAHARDGSFPDGRHNNGALIGGEIWGEMCPVPAYRPRKIVHVGEHVFEVVFP